MGCYTHQRVKDYYGLSHTIYDSAIYRVATQQYFCVFHGLPIYIWSQCRTVITWTWEPVYHCLGRSFIGQRVFAQKGLHKYKIITFVWCNYVGITCGKMRSCMVCTLRPVLLGWSKQGGWDGRGMWHAWGWWGVHTTFCLGGLKGGDH
jgi:hypothetical protein